MEKFELFMCCMGNGTTVCNKAIENFGDYLQVAHISESGKIRWYVPSSTIPGDALLKIEHYANTTAANFWKRFDSLSIMSQYGYLLDRAKLSDFLEVVKMKDKSVEGKVEYLKTVVDI